MSLDKKKLGEEELKRALLMMKYDSRKTLSENVDEQLGTAAAVGAGTGAAIGAASTGAVGGYTALGSTAFAVGSALGVGAAASMAIIGGLAGIALVPLAYWLITKDTGAERIKNIFQMCSTDSAKIAKLERKIDDKTIRNLSDQIYDATEGVGTNEESLFGAFESLRDGTASDACALVNRFNREHGDLFEWLDDDIDASSEWDRIYRPFRDCVEDTLLSMKDDNVQTSPEDQVSQNAKNCGWLKTDGSADVEGYRNSNWKCPKSGKSGGGTGGGSYKDCSGTYTKGCKSEKIREVQGCLGLKTDGKFGDNTQKALVAKGYPNGFTDADVNKICNVQTSPEVPSPETPKAEFNQNDWL